MGLDFIEKCTPRFKRSWDRNRSHLAQPDLFNQFPELKSQTYRLVGKEAGAFQKDKVYLLKLDHGAILAFDDSVLVGAIQEPPSRLVEAVTAGSNFAVGKVSDVMMDGRVADVFVS